MTRIIASLGVANEDPGGNAESNTAFNVSGEFRRYMEGASSNFFSPFLGGGVGIEDSGFEGSDPNLEVFGGFGGEAFVVEALSIGGNVGIGYTKEGDVTIDDGDPLTPDTVEGNKTFGTLRSAITATLYWGGSSSPVQDPIGTNGDSHSPRGDEVLA
jgi:hypothetical protein